MKYMLFKWPWLSTFCRGISNCRPCYFSFIKRVDSHTILYRWRNVRTCLRAYADSEGANQRLHCPLTELLGTTECMNGEQRPGWYFAHAQDDLNRRILCLFKGTFSFDAAHIVFIFVFVYTRSIHMKWRYWVYAVRFTNSYFIVYFLSW